MTVILVFLALLMAGLVFWLLRQTVGVKPWVAESAPADRVSHVPEFATAPRVGLVVFLAVVTSLFGLALSAYMMRMEIAGDWRPLPEPGLLWVNTGLLVLGSVFFQWGWNAARRDDAAVLGKTLAIGGAFTVAFIGGQYLVWLQLMAGGHYLTTNPANAFFYMLTALHAAHLLGGLVVWGWLMFKLRRGAEPLAVRSGVELCTLYWHYLLAVWAVLFSVVLTT